MDQSPQSLTRRDALKVLGAGATVATLPSANTAPSPTGSVSDSLQGKKVTRGDAAFEATRRELTWNARMPDERPGLIVRAKTAMDVADAVKEARARRLRIALRSGGHNYHSSFLREGSVLIDAGGLRSLQIDASRRSASIGPGVKGGELLSALESTGLGFPVGHCHDVSVGGYLLGGGVGWNAGEWGPACMSVTGMDLVLASGAIIHADAGHNADLFWAARGAGRGFFAAVTRYEVKLNEAPRVVRGFLMSFEMDSLDLISRWVQESLASVHPTVEVVTFLISAGGGAPALVNVAAYGMGATEQEALGKLGALRTPPAGARPVGDIQSVASRFWDLKTDSGGFPEGKRMHGDMRFCSGSVRDVLNALKPMALSGSVAPSFLMCVNFGRGSVVPHQGGGLFQMAAPNFVGLYSFHDMASDDENQRRWIRSAVLAIEPFVKGAYINEADISSRADVARLCFSAVSWNRLEALKRQYDPDMLFPGFS